MSSKQVTAQIELVKTQLKEQQSGFFSPIAGSASDKDLLSLETKLATLKLIEQTSIDIKNQNINGLLDSLSPPPGFGTDLTEIKINPNLKIREDSLKKFYEDLDAITQTSGEKLLSDTIALQAKLDLLVKDGIISQSDAFNRARGPADTKHCPNSSRTTRRRRSVDPRESGFVQNLLCAARGGFRGHGGGSQEELRRNRAVRGEHRPRHSKTRSLRLSKYWAGRIARSGCRFCERVQADLRASGRLRSLQSARPR